MNKSLTRSFSHKLSVIILIVLFSSCASTKKVSYFQDIPQVGEAQLKEIAQFTEPVIQPDDILSINFFSIDPQTAAVINQGSTLQALGASTLPINQQSTGFMVDKNGDVELVGVGKVRLGGLTTYQAKELIRKKVEADFKNPSIEVRFVNFKITVLGEVNRPAVYTLQNEKVTFLDALGMAGDMTIFGRRENVMLIRDNAGKKEFVRFDLNSTAFLNSPYFYLKQNDVIYIEPNKGKAASLNAARTQTYAIIGSALSVLVILFSRL
jgi:polysaccharide export outer membrane protein